jgi:hypothetical protein
MIELDEFAMTRNDYFRLIFRHTLKIVCWGYAYVAVILIALMIPSGNWYFLFVSLVVTLIVYSILLFILCRYLLPSAKETHFYQKRKISFDVDKFHIQCEDGSESHILLSHVVRADIAGNFYRLYLNKRNYSAILVSAFKSEEDRLRFETEILGDKLKTQAVPWKAILIFLVVSACLLGAAFAMSQAV